MDQDVFAKADEDLDDLSEIVDELLESNATKKLKEALAAFSKSLGQRYSVGMDVIVHVFDGEKERSTPLLTTGLGTSNGSDPCRTWGDSTPERYVADGEIQVIPHDRCPICWDVWDNKFETLKCRHCGVTLGDEVKVLLDKDVCPHCEDGKVTPSSPKCDKCGYEVNPIFVVWG